MVSRWQVQVLRQLLPQIPPGALFECKHALEKYDIFRLKDPARAWGAVVADSEQDLLQRSLGVILHCLQPSGRNPRRLVRQS